MNYKIFDKDGNEVNRIFASEDFVTCYCNLHGYTYEAEPMPEPEHVTEPTAEPTLEERVVILEEQLADTDEVAIQLYEASLAQEAVNAEQDEAIIEIYETMEGIING